MPSSGPPLLLAHHHRAPFGAHDHLVFSELEIHHGYLVFILTGCEKRRFVDQVFEIRTHEARGARS